MTSWLFFAAAGKTTKTFPFFSKAFGRVAPVVH